MSVLLSLLSGGVIGGFIGAFLGGFVKFLWENWLPSALTWRHEQKIQREKFLSQFRDPAVRATLELRNRVFAIITTEDFKFVKKIGQEDYYITSTVFLLAQFFAWVEILHRMASMLDYYKLMNSLDAVVNEFSSGEPGFQIFHLEQREIGERMITSSSDQTEGYYCLGYADFLNLIREDKAPVCFSTLDGKVRELLNKANELPVELPVRKRLVRIQNALIDVMNLVDPEGHWAVRYERTKLPEPNDLSIKSQTHPSPGLHNQLDT